MLLTRGPKFKITWFLITTLSLMGLSGCASRRDVLRCQEELFYIRTQLQKLNRQVEDNQKTLVQLNQTVQNNQQMQYTLNGLRDSLTIFRETTARLRADMISELASIKDYSAYLNNKFEDVNMRSSMLLSKVESLTTKVAARVSLSPNPEASGDSVNNPSEIFNNAYLDMTRNNYDLALQGFRTYLNLFAESELADYCQFYIAEIYFQNNDYEKAAQEYELVLTRYPKSPKIANTLLKLGICYKELNNDSKARQYFNEVIEKFPYTEEAAQAKMRL